MKKLSALLITGGTYLTLALPASAEEKSISFCPVATENSNFESLCSITLNGNLFQTVITTIFVIATLLALAFLVFGGIKWITSGGDKAGVESARNMIVAALVGLVIAFLSYFILSIVLNFFGITTTDGMLSLPNLYKCKSSKQIL